MLRRILLPLLSSLFLCSAAFAQSAPTVSVSIIAPETVDASASFAWSFDVINNGPPEVRDVNVGFEVDPPLATNCYPTHINVIYGDGVANVSCFTAALNHAGPITLRASAGDKVATRTIQAVVGPNLAISVRTNVIDPGLPFDIQFFWANLSKTLDATNVTASVTLPADVRPGTLPSNCTAADNRITCAIGTVPANTGSTGLANLTVTAIAGDSTNGKLVQLVADIAGSEPDGQQENNHYTYNARAYRTMFVTDTAADSLANAIDQANRDCNDDYPCKIAFRLGAAPANGYFTLKPARALPAVTALNLAIDGTTQTRLFGDSNPNGPEIFLDGTDSAFEDGLSFASQCGAEVSGFAIGNFRNAAVTLTATDPPFPCTTYYFTRSIHDNYLGVDPTGTHAAPNGRGIVFNERLYYSSTVVKGNLISGNRRSGIWMGRGLHNSIVSNTIGLDMHYQPLPNGASGIYIGPEASDADIRGNFVAFNQDFGIAVDRRAVGTDIGPNSIYANAQIGIDIGLDGPTAKSDPVPAPDILSATYDPATDKTVVVVATSEKPTVINPTLDIYASDEPHPSGYGDGQYLIGIVARFDPTKGNITFAAAGDWRGKWVSATVTRNYFYGFLTMGPAPTAEFPDTHSTTSEFSRAVRVGAGS